MYKCMYKFTTHSLSPPHPTFRETQVASRNLSGCRWCIRLLLLISVLLWRLWAGWDRSFSTLVCQDSIIHSPLFLWLPAAGWSCCVHMFQMVWGGFCVRLVCRKVPKEKTRLWSTDWCSMTPRCGKVMTHKCYVLCCYVLCLLILVVMFCVLFQC